MRYAIITLKNRKDLVDNEFAPYFIEVNELKAQELADEIQNHLKEMMGDELLRMIVIGNNI